MIVSTTDSIPGREIDEILGLARGNVVRTKHIGRDIQAALRSLVGGEVGGYTEMLSEAREHATRLMILDAEDLGADALVNVRYTTSAVASGMSEILAYGTAVRLR